MKHKSDLTIIVILALCLLVFAAPLAARQTAEATGDSTAAIYDADTILVVEELWPENALALLQSGELDVYTFPTSDPAIAQQIQASADLDAYRTLGIYTELTFNPSGPIFAGTGKLNPFAVPRVREAMNWLVDRDHIAEVIYSGLAVPRLHPLNTVSNDYARLADAVRQWELFYAYNKALASQVIGQEMVALGANLQNGRWYYAGQPVEIILLIRTEDERRNIGDYLGDQLEDIGFTVIRNYQTAAGAAPIWINGDPADGLFHIYTGGWISTAIPRDLAGNFSFFYTNRGLPSPLWEAYVNTPEFYDLATRLDERDFATAQERLEMMAQALEWALADSHRIWLVDRVGLTPRRAEISYASDLYGGIIGSWLWPHTLRREGGPATPLTIGSPAILNAPWNPLNGSDWSYDLMIIRATSDNSLVPDPYTGLAWPQRGERAEVVAQTGLPIAKSLDWVTLQFTQTVIVPDDAWVDWDATEQRFLTAAEMYTEPQTALYKSIIYYPETLYEDVTWHDGSPFSAADVVLRLILAFDRAKEESAVYDPSQLPVFHAFMSNFRGVRILSEDPLVIEHYGNNWQMDAELMVNGWWPYYATGPGAWHTLALGLLVEAAGEAAFSMNKADANEVPWLDYLSDPGLSLLNTQLVMAQAADYVPYAPTLGAYIGPAQAAERWDNLAAWFAEQSHFWVGTGPLYLDQVGLEMDELSLKRYPAYPDPPDRWDDFWEPAVPEVSVVGPDSIERGEEAVFTIEISRNGQPYPDGDIEAVRYLVLDSRNRTRLSGEAMPMMVGEATAVTQWRVVLDAAATSSLPGGPNRLEIVVVSNRVVIPSFASQLVAAPNWELFLPAALR